MQTTSEEFPAKKILNRDAKTEASETRFAFGILLICVGVLSLGPGLLIGQPGRDIFGFLGAICFVSLFAASGCSFTAIGLANEQIQLFALIKLGNIVSVGTTLLLCLLICSSVLSFLDPASPLWFFVGLMPLISFAFLGLSNVLGFVSVCYLKRKSVFALFVSAQFVLLLSVVFSFLMMIDISSTY